MTDNHSYAQICRFFTDRVIKTMDRSGSAEYRENADSPVALQAGADLFSRARDIWRQK